MHSVKAMIDSAKTFKPIVVQVDFNLRNYFAAKAMQSLVAHAASAGFSSHPNQIVSDSATAYEWADAMIKESKNATI